MPLSEEPLEEEVLDEEVLEEEDLEEVDLEDGLDFDEYLCFSCLDLCSCLLVEREEEEEEEAGLLAEWEERMGQAQVTLCL